jgi:hypothetical protein
MTIRMEFVNIVFTNSFNVLMFKKLLYFFSLIFLQHFFLQILRFVKGKKFLIKRTRHIGTAAYALSRSTIGLHLACIKNTF